MIQVESIHEKFGRELINKWYEVFGRMKGIPVTKNGDKDASPMEAVSLSVAAKTLLYGVHGEYNELASRIEFLERENASLIKLVGEKNEKIADLGDAVDDLGEVVEELKEVDDYLKTLEKAAGKTEDEYLNLQTVVEDLNKELLRVKLQRDLAVKELEAQKTYSQKVWRDQVVVLGDFLKSYPSHPTNIESFCYKAIRTIKDLQAQVDRFAGIKKIYNDNGDALLKLGAFLINYPSNDNETTTQKAARIVKEAECFCAKLEIANNGLRKVNEDLLQGVYGPNAEQLKKEVEELKKHCPPVLKLLTVDEIAEIISPWVMGQEDVETAMRKLIKAQLQKDQRATGG